MEARIHTAARKIRELEYQITELLPVLEDILRPTLYQEAKHRLLTALAVAKEAYEISIENSNPSSKE